jgi:hypothetical protein
VRETEDAFCVPHVRVEVPPVVIEVGLAVSEQVGGGGGVVTVTVL